MGPNLFEHNENIAHVMPRGTERAMTSCVHRTAHARRQAGCPMYTWCTDSKGSTPMPLGLRIMQLGLELINLIIPSNQIKILTGHTLPMVMSMKSFLMTARTTWQDCNHHYHHGC